MNGDFTTPGMPGQELMDIVEYSNGDVLYIRGTDAADIITVEYDLDNPDKVIASVYQLSNTLKLVELQREEFRISRFDHIEIRGFGGNDLIYNETNLETTIWGGDGNDTIYGGSGRDTIQGGLGDDYIDGRAGDDSLWGDDGSDTLIGGKGNDYIFGGRHNDFLQGDEGNDSLVGGLGDDAYYFTNSVGFDLGSDRVFEWSSVDRDTLDFSGLVGTSWNWGGVHIDLGKTIPQQINGMYSNFALTLTLSSTSVENVIGTELPDFIYGNQLGNHLQGLGGNDFIYGFGGNDTLDGGNGSDWLDGGEGNDLLIGGAGNDIYSFTELNGETSLGHDTIQENANVDADILTFWQLSRGISVDIARTTKQTVVPNFLELTLTDATAIEMVYGSDYSDYIAGNSRDNSLYGNGGNDVLHGRDGNDTISGGSGSDWIYGGNGNDRLFGDFGNDWIYGGEGNDYLNGGNDNDWLYGEGGLDTLVGGAGADYLNGGYQNPYLNDGHRDVLFGYTEYSNNDGAKDIFVTHTQRLRLFSPIDFRTYYYYATDVWDSLAGFNSNEDVRQTFDVTIY